MVTDPCQFVSLLDVTQGTLCILMRLRCQKTIDGAMACAKVCDHVQCRAKVCGMFKQRPGFIAAQSDGQAPSLDSARMCHTQSRPQVPGREMAQRCSPAAAGTSRKLLSRTVHFFSFFFCHTWGGHIAHKILFCN